VQFVFIGGVHTGRCRVSSGRIGWAVVLLA
jgi:hypothetical protein